MSGKVSKPDDLPELVKNVIFEIFTWGSCREGNPYIIYPIKRNLSPLTSTKGEHEVVVNSIARIKYYNYDSSRNKHRIVEFVEVKHPIIVHYDVSWSCNRHEDFVFLVTPEGFKKLNVQEEVVEVENDKFREMWKKIYVEYNGNKIILREVRIWSELIKEKLVVRVSESNGRVLVYGDTYYIKDDLKKHGFRWDGWEKAWFTETMSKERVIEIVKGLGVQVVVE
jgi:translation elongation factor P/translation initiation factor 5A